jgi:heparin binding hemagglutinin HbhA
MTQPTKNRIPRAVYAAAGAGDLAYRRLRKLPAVLGALTGKAAAGTADLRGKAGVNSTELRKTARRNAAAVVAGAQVVQEKATKVYEELVAHGARVIGRSGETVAADAELESEGAVAPALPVAPVASDAAADTAAAAGAASPAPAPAKPVKKATKRTRPAAGE